MTDSDVLLVDRRDAVWLATLNRPAKGNALNQPLVDALDALADAIEASASTAQPVRALVITGTGDKAFSAGADITELNGISGAVARAQMQRGQAVFSRIERLPAIVIAAVNGVALGGGCELAMAADLRIAAPHARFGQPEITLANLPGWGGTQRLPRLVGRARATELIVTGDHVPAHDAERVGLVNRVADDCVAAAVELAQRIAARSAAAVTGAKAAIRVGLEEGMTRGLQVEADAVAACCETDEQRRAVAAFLNRRPRPPTEP